MSKYKKFRKNELAKLKKKTDMAVLAAAIAVLLLFFGSIALYNFMIGPDGSVDLQAVKSNLLIKPHNIVLGASSAKVTVVEFMDLECRSCRSAHWELKNLAKKYGDTIKIVRRYLPHHGNSRLAAAALEEAHEVGKYEKTLDTLFEKQSIWGSHTDPRPDLISEYLAEIGVEKVRLQPGKLLQKHNWKIDLDEKDAHFLGVRSSHTFFVNGKILRHIDSGSIKSAIDLAIQN